jgi:hypothetical protein
MPNWCHNHTTIEGSQHTLQWLQEIEFDFNRIRPRPQEVADWYDWNVTHWGTKWEARDVEFELNDDGITISYDTAWAPPVALLIYLSEQHQLKITNYCVDEGYGFVGNTIINNGIEDTEYIEPFSHDDAYLASYAANHSWFPHEELQRFIRIMEGND